MSAVDISTLGIAVESSGVETASNRLDRLSQEGGKAEAATSKLTSSFDGLSRYAKLAGEALAAWKLAELAKEAALLTARYDTLGVVMVVTGKNAAYTASQMSEFQASLQKTGISAIESRNGLIRMGQAQIDMANSAKLARVAQDAAVVGNINSSEAFERVMTGLATGQSIILHHLGLMTNFEQAYIKAADAMGKTTNDLSETEKAQIRVNEVMRASVGIQGAYEAAMGTVGKQLTSLPRYIQDLMVKIGEMGQGPLFVVVKGLGDALKYVNNNFEQISETAKTIGTGGAIVAIGALASKIQAVAYQANIAQLQTIALRDNTLFDAAAATTAATAHNAEAVALVNTTRARLAAMDAQIAETKAAFWASNVYKERVALDTQLIALEEGRARVVGQLAAAEGAATTSAASLSAATEAEAAAMTAASFATRAMSGAMAGLNSVMALVGGPIGMIAIAIAGVTYEVVKFLEKAEAAQNRLMQLQNNGDFAQTLAKLKEIEDLNRRLEQDKKSPEEVAKDNTAKMQEKINKALKDNIELEKQRQALIASGDNKTASETWSGKVTEWDKVNAKIKDNNNLIQYGMKVNAEMNTALAKQAELRKSMHQEPPKPNTIDPEKQLRYDQQVMEAEAKLQETHAANRKQREDSALQQRLEALNTEKAHGLKTAEEYLNAKYDLEREYMQKELDASNALLEQRYQDYSKISNDPAADRLQQSKAEESYQKQLGESLKIVEKMNAANREKSHDNESLAQQRINEGIRRTNDLYNEQLKVRQQLQRLDNDTAMAAANLVGVNPNTGSIDTIADGVAHDLAVQQAAHEQKIKMIQEERDTYLDLMMSGRIAYEDFIEFRQKLDKQAAIENQDHSVKNAAIAQKAYKSQLSMAAQYTGLASQLFGELANAQDQSSRKGFENAKMYSTAAAIMSTAAAVMNALATVQPYPLAVAAAATAAAIGAIQIATIQSTSFGGGGTVPSVPSGSYGGSGSTTAGTGIGAPVKSVAELQTEESLRKLANAAESASLAVSKVADGLTKISQLFETSYSDNLSKGLTGAAAGSASGNFWGASKTAGGWGAGMFGGVMDPSLAAAVNAPIGGGLNHMFGWGNKWARTDGGISLGLEDGNLTGQSFNEYRKKGGWFTSGKKRDEYGELDPQILSAMDSYMSRIKSSILIAATSMGTSTDFGKATLQSMNISTAGRKPEDIQKDLEKFFTDAADTLAKTTKGLEKFAFFGENAFDALIRLSTSLQGVNELFELTGKTLVSSTLAGANAAYKLADAFGGLDKMQDSVNDYFKAMFSESEQDALKAAQNLREVNTAFKTMGLSVPKTTEEFIKLVNSLDVTTDKGAALYKALMDVAPEFADLKKYLEDLSNTAIDNAYAVLQKSVQAEKDTLQKWYSAHSEHLDKLWAKSQEAYKKEEDAARTRLTKVQGAANSIKSAYDNLSAPDSESLMSREYAERMIRTYANSNKIPLNGELDKALKAVSQPSQNLFSSDVDYRRDFYRTAADLATLNKRAQGQLSDAEKQLQQLQQNNELAKKAYDDQKKAAKAAYDAQIAALDKTLAKAEEQIKAIRGTTVAVMSVDKALANLTTVIAKQTLATGGDKAAVNELKELRAELRAQNGAMAKYMLKMAKYIEQWEDEGMPKTRTA